MKTTIKTISSPYNSAFDKDVNSFLKTIDDNKNFVKLNYQFSKNGTGVECHSVMIEITEKEINPLLAAINRNSEKATESTNNF